MRARVVTHRTATEALADPGMTPRERLDLARLLPRGDYRTIRDDEGATRAWHNALRPLIVRGVRAAGGNLVPGGMQTEVNGPYTRAGDWDAPLVTWFQVAGINRSGDPSLYVSVWADPLLHGARWPMVFAGPGERGQRGRNGPDPVDVRALPGLVARVVAARVAEVGAEAS